MSLRILAIEPYHGLSHKSFLEGYRDNSAHEVVIWSLPPRKWKWRMRGSAFHFARKARDLPQGEPFDVIFCSDFLNLADFIALSPRHLRNLPTLAYFHENQITYPLGEKAPVDFHYGWINLSTALAADRVLFNSLYHRNSFLREVRKVLDRMPDYVPGDLVDSLLNKSGVFPVGTDFRLHDEVLAALPERQAPATGDRALTILWNHRWEYDKGPDRFFETLESLQQAGVPFRLVVCGQSFARSPEIFDHARKVLADRIDHFGFFPDARSYLQQVGRSDIVVSTAVHEFFGVSVVDAIYCGCLPVLPRRLSYPEIVPPHLHPLFLYDRDEDLPQFLTRMLESPPEDYREELREEMARYDWRQLASGLDAEMETLARG